MKAYFSLEQFEGRAAFRTWLTRIKANHCLNHLQRRRGVRYVDFEEAEKAGSASIQLEGRFIDYPIAYRAQPVSGPSCSIRRSIVPARSRT